MSSRIKYLWAAALLLLIFSGLRAQDAEYYRTRRIKLAGKLEGAAALIPAAWEQDPFRQGNNLYYFTGIEQPDILLLISPVLWGAEKEILFLPARNPSEGSLSEAWTGEKLGPGAQTQKQTGLDKAVDKNTFESTFARLVADIDRLYFDYTPSDLNGPVSAAEVLLRSLRERYPHLQILPLARLADSMRIVKDSVEISTLEKAIDITGQSLIETIKALKPGMYEYEVEALIEYGFHRRGSQRPGFVSIVGSGPNSAVLHYNKNRRRIGDQELVLMDAGAELNYYTADITRTVPSGGRFTKFQRQIYELVLEAQGSAIKAVRPGITLKEVHQAARKTIEDAGYGNYFIHYTSHFLGMDVHDVGSRDIPLQPGMVLTVEPGIYLPEESFGVRIEDDVLVTADGCRVLSASIPKTVEQIESLMRSK
ncbi:MAG TPA: Xaa-Pro peptidase family protein [archaeon]|nr:Xaa-Pro peptidase family protein [archaeon]